VQTAIGIPAAPAASVAGAGSGGYNDRVRRTLRPLACLLVTLPLGACATYEGARLYQRGTAELDRGEPGAAILDLEHAATLVPESSEIQNHLGLAYSAAGRDGDALRAFRRAVDLDCDNHAARENLAAAEAVR
jgi:Flp pilus assembly protein TadD